MDFSRSVLDEIEEIGFLLRDLYQEQGFSRYRMSKFEEYDLYSRNRDYLLSNGVITFTNPDGRLMALKPDVTLSIVKNIRDIGSGLHRLYYHENVYRVSSESDGFREETQVGVECMGQVNCETLTEVLRLACRSLSLLSSRAVLSVSHLGLLGALADALAPDASLRERILECAEQKNTHGIREICAGAGLKPEAAEPLLALLSLAGPVQDVLPQVARIAGEAGCGGAAEELREILSPLAGEAEGERLWIDFSAAGNLKYYNGLAFRGFLEGIPDPVLSGGQYDQLMRRMGRKDKAVGFAVFLHRLERLHTEGRTRS